MQPDPTAEAATKPEERERRCPRLGHQLSFAYCLKCGEQDGPCFKTVDCWWEYFDVKRYLNDNFPPETVQVLLENKPPPPKVSGLVEMIEQARQRLKKDGQQA